METKQPNSMDRTIVKVKKVIDGIYEFFAGITNFHREMDIDEAAQFYTEKLDSYMASARLKAQNSLIAGQLTFQYVDENVFLIKLDVYYQTDDGKWMQESAQTTRALKYLKPAAAQELREKREISFEAEDAPKEAVLAEQEAVQADDAVSLPESAEGMQSSPLPVSDEKKEASAHLHAPAAPQPELQAAVQNAVPMEPLSAASAEDAPKEAVLAEQKTAVQTADAMPLQEPEGMQSSSLPAADEKRA